MVIPGTRRIAARRAWLALRVALALACGPGAALAQAPPPAPAVPPAERPAAEETAPPDALQKAVTVAQQSAEQARTLLDRHILVVGAGYHEIALRADTSSDSQDAAVFLPTGPSGKGILGDRVGRVATLKVDLLSPVQRFKGSEVFGWGYNIGLSRVRFDKYESFISDRVTYNGELTGTFAHVIPTLVVSRPQDDDSTLYSRGEMGIGLVAYRFTGAMHIRRNYLIPNVDYLETFVGDGKVRYGPALFIDTQYVFARRVSLGFSMLIMSYAGYYYSDLGFNAGLAFVF